MLIKPNKPFSEYDYFDMIRIYSRTLSFKDAANLVGVSKWTWTQHWYSLGLPSPITTKHVRSERNFERYSIAIVSDLHWGSIYQQKTVFDKFIQECKDKNINTLIGCGDLIDGVISRQYHNNTRFLHQISDFEQYVKEHYPTGFDTSIIIQGNHEQSLTKYIRNYNFCNEISKERTDLTYLSKNDIFIGPGNIKFYICHGGGSCAYPGESRDRRLKMKTLQLLSEGHCASIYLYGHCHSCAYIPSYMDRTIIGTGCFQAPDMSLTKNYGGVDICGLILNYSVNELGQLVNVNLDWRFAKDYGGIIENDY